MWHLRGWGSKSSCAICLMVRDSLLKSVSKALFETCQKKLHLFTYFALLLQNEPKKNGFQSENVLALKLRGGTRHSCKGKRESVKEKLKLHTSEFKVTLNYERWIDLLWGRLLCSKIFILLFGSFLCWFLSWIGRVSADIYCKAIPASFWCKDLQMDLVPVYHAFLGFESL